MKTLPILSIIVATGLAGAAVAQTNPTASATPAPTAGRGMSQDGNGDGIITRQEALDAAGARFDRMDTNHDSRIDATERQAARAMRRGRGYDGDMSPQRNSDDR